MTGREKCGQNRQQRCRHTNGESERDQQPVLAEHQALQFSATETYGLQKRKFAAPFQDVAQHHNAEAQASEQQPKAAQRLKDRDVCIFDFLKIGKPSPCRNDLQPSIA